jgi:hypothetical protein
MILYVVNIFEYDPNTGEILDKNTTFTWSTLIDVSYRKEFNEKKTLKRLRKKLNES